MNLELSSEAVEFGLQAARALRAAGGDDLVQRAETDPTTRHTTIAAVLERLGAWDLSPRRDPIELEAAAALCRSAGYWAIPYPVAERLSRPADLDADALVVVAGPEPAAAIDGLDLRVVAVDPEGRRGTVTARRAGKRTGLDAEVHGETFTRPDTRMDGEFAVRLGGGFGGEFAVRLGGGVGGESVGRAGGGTVEGTVAPTDGRTARETVFVTPIAVRPLDTRGADDLALALVLPCWTLLGMLDRAMELAGDHVLVREQFGRRLADFQSVQFQLTDAEVERKGVEMLARYALWSIQTGQPDAVADALAARLAVLEAAEIVFRVAHQVHGAVGFCDETTLSWLSRHSLPLRRLPLGITGTEDLLTRRIGARGLAGPFSDPRGA
ncbi:acyl-CoA dehydrogenase family protein [Nocardia sp. NPDC058518]|uniref:acyl-CoA dehydrogenase family protein n=1 Tax=Nocardia sp. NPDC058518 TaxID=3346534 RepID=UPI00364BD05A